MKKIALMILGLGCAATIATYANTTLTLAADANANSKHSDKAAVVKGKPASQDFTLAADNNAAAPDANANAANQANGANNNNAAQSDPNANAAAPAAPAAPAANQGQTSQADPASAVSHDPDQNSDMD